MTNRAILSSYREPGNKTLQRGRIFRLVLFKKRVTDTEMGPAGQKQSGAGAGKRFLVYFFFIIIEKDQELVSYFEKSFENHLKIVIHKF